MTAPAPPPRPERRVPAGWEIPESLDRALRDYQNTTGARRQQILDHALREYLTARGVLNEQ